MIEINIEKILITAGKLALFMVLPYVLLWYILKKL